MAIEKSTYEQLIQDIQVGNSVAEQDVLLESARVETPVFSDVMNDKYDIILGRKGAGKTAIFKIIDILSNLMFVNRNIVILSGVNSKGESIFNEFKEEFAEFSEKDFDIFWKFYFVSLIYNEFIKEEIYTERLKSCKDEIKKFISECERVGIPQIPNKQEKKQVIQWLVGILQTKIKKIKIDTKLDIKSPNLFSLSPEIEFDNSVIEKEKRNIVYINDISKAIKVILKKSGLKIWIILDRLDEVFDRYSDVEFKGLRGLLSAYRSFIIDDTDLLRIKLFLRDDILEFLTDSKIYKKYFKGKNIPPMPAATHIFDKQSPTLNWTEDEVEQLVLNRLLLSKILRKHIGIDPNITSELLKNFLRNKNKRQTYWNKIFPEMISTSTSLKWLFTRLKDANGIVTPRSVIDMLEGAIQYQRKKISVNYEDCEQVFPVDAIKEGLRIASTNKLFKDIYNEFPREQENIKKLSKEGKVKLTKSELKNMYGNNWEDVVSNLNRIGIIKYVKDSGSYRIEYLFRPALNIAYAS